MPDLITLTAEGNSRIEIKQSVFIGRSIRIYSKEEAEDFIRQEKNKYPDARHCCYAWRLRQGSLSKSSDDGEPSGTAGMPLLSLLNSNDINDCAVCVTRYFGGILLGKGGLVRAYTEAGRDALASGKPSSFKEGIEYSVLMDYSLYDRFLREACDRGYLTGEGKFEQKVELKVRVASEQTDAFEKFATDISSGSIKLAKGDKCEIDGEVLDLF
ncbi:MAG: IMPACT family protein [Saccharofermentans sp.]|nr:IMPACT family protein [Saccharofermentans sp.]